MADVHQLEVSKEFNAQALCSMSEPILGVDLSFDELKLLCFSQNNIYIFDIPEASSSSMNITHQRCIKHSFDVDLCKFSKFQNYHIALKDDQDNVHVHTNCLDSSSNTHSKNFKGCSDVDWCPYSNTLAMVQQTSIIILNSDLSELYAIHDYSIDLVTHFNFIHWVSKSTSQNDYFVLGCQCVIPSDDDDNDEDEEEEEQFVSLAAVQVTNNSALTQLAYFEDVCQDMKIIDQKQKFIAASMKET